MSFKPLLACGVAVAALTLHVSALAQKEYDPGVSDTEIKIGQTMPYSGPASSYGTIGRAEAAYFKKVNDEGGVNGRKIVFLSLDDGYSPPKTVEATRRLVEQDQVLLMFGSLGTATNTAVHAYLNGRKVPQLFISTGASKWNDPQNRPWTMGFQPNYHDEAQIYVKYILQTKPNARIGILYQNDDYGKDYLKGVKDGLGEKSAKMLVAELTYEVTDATVDSQIVQMQGMGVDVLIDATSPKFAAQAIRKAYDIGWKPLHFLNNTSVSVGSVLTPAGLEKSIGLVTGRYYKDPTDARWDGVPGMIAWRAFMKTYYPEGSLIDSPNLAGYAQARTLVQVLKQCGDNLTRENVMKQAASLRDFGTGVILPGITLNTSTSDFAPIKAIQLARFDGKSWVPLSEEISR